MKEGLRSLFNQLFTGPYKFTHLLQGVSETSHVSMKVYMYEVGNIYLWRGYTVMQDINSEKCEYHRYEWYLVTMNTQVNERR